MVLAVHCVRINAARHHKGEEKGSLIASRRTINCLQDVFIPAINYNTGSLSSGSTYCGCGGSSLGSEGFD